MSHTPPTHCKSCSSRLEPWLSASGALCSMCINPHCSDATEYPRLSPLPGQDSLGARLAAAAQVGQVEGAFAFPLPRLLRSPVGAWVHLHTKRYFTLYLTCGAATRQGVLTGERRA